MKLTMRKTTRTLQWLVSVTLLLASVAAAQTKAPMSWEQVRQRFEQNNPTLLAGQLNIEESKAQELTANMRPNPSAQPDGRSVQSLPRRPRAQLLRQPAHRSRRQLSARARAQARAAPGERAEGHGHRRQHPGRSGTLAALRPAHGLRRHSAGQGRAATGEGQPRLLRPCAGDQPRPLCRRDIAQIDLDRLELQRVQYESDLETALVNLRTAKITC